MSRHFSSDFSCCLVLFLLLAVDPNAASDDGNLIAMPVETSRVPSDGISTPKSVDWRKLGAVTAVKDRKRCQNGSWAFAAAEAIEAINKIATGRLVELSPQQLLDCSGKYGSNGCRVGFPQNAFEYLTDTGVGLSIAADYPFSGFNATCRKHNRYSVFIDDYDNFYGSSDDSEILAQVAKQPVTAMIDGNAPAFVNYKGGIYKGPCRNDQASPPLSVLIVGYGSQNGDDYWIIKNSAGTSWGEKGYMRLQRGNHSLPLGRCGVNGFVYFPLKKKLAPPPPRPPPPPPPRPSPPRPPSPRPPRPCPPRPPPRPSPPPVPCYKRINCGIFPSKFPCCPVKSRPVCCPFGRTCRPSGCF